MTRAPEVECCGRPNKTFCDDLFALLEEHNFKEERILYPAADELISQEGASRLRAEIGSVALPASWRCEALRAGAPGGESD